MKFLIFLLLAFSGVVHAQALKVIGWNVESGGARLSGLTPRISGFDDCDIFGLSEVRNSDWAAAFEKAAEEGQTTSYSYVLGTTGGADRLMILFNDERLDFISSRELHWINPEDRVRAPLVAHLRDKQSGTELLFMVNHLYRSRAEKRHLQSGQLNEWASQQALPVIAVGDFNYDWEVEGGDIDHDEGYDLLTSGGVFQWIRPHGNLVKTQSSNYNSVLDFVFASPAAQAWEATSRIIVQDGDFPDNQATSDHRPVAASFVISTPLVEPAGGLVRLELLGSTGADEKSAPAGMGLVDPRMGSERTNDADKVAEVLRRLKQSAGGARFDGRVVGLWLEDPNSPDRQMLLMENFAFIDASGKKWEAPKGSKVDGASIPSVFWNKYIGPPFVGDYRRASVVHDVACELKTEPHRAVHRMFYEACVVGGVTETKAKMMYFTVRKFGPKWKTGGGNLKMLRSQEDLIDGLVRIEEIEQMLLENPDMSFDQLQALLDGLEDQ